MAPEADPSYIDIPLNIYFSTKNPVPIQRIANSLLALDQLSKRFPELIAELTGVDLGKDKVGILSLSQAGPASSKTSCCWRGLTAAC